MIASLFIIVVSAFLFVYWFRYTCLLILGTRSARNYTRTVAEANGLGFLQARTELTGGAPMRFDHIHESLQRDYRVVTYLLRHAASYNSDGQSFEQLLLKMDYRLMSIWYRLVRGASGSLARHALLEMTSVIGHLANAMGERTAAA